MSNEDDFSAADMENDSLCDSCGKRKKGCISFFAHENDMMHKDIDNERAHKTILFVCATFIVITVIFVFAYTVRMNSFLNTINKLTADIVNLASAKGVISP